MTAKPRWAAAAAVVVFMVLVGLVVGPGSSAAAAGNPNTPGERSLAACLQTSTSVSVLFLLDRSGSLNTNDPAGVRYEGLQLALERLSGIRKNALGEVAIDAGVASFDDQYAGVGAFGGWRRVNGDKGSENVEDLLTTARANTAPRGATLYEPALTKAAADLADRAGDRSCRVLIWFTDGEMTDKPEASQRMCASGGLMDQLRGQGITVVGLRLQDSSGGPAPQTANMAAMTVGQDATSTCGTWPIPEGSHPGIFLEARDKAGLRRLFARALDGADGCSQLPGPTVDPGMRRFRVVIDAPAGLTSVRFDGPGGAQLVAPVPGSAHSGGLVSHAGAVDGLVTVDVELPRGQGGGPWTVTPNVAVSPGELTHYECPDLSLAVDPSIRPLAGDTTTIPLQLRDGTGAPADLAAYRDLVASVVVTGPDGQPRKTVAGQAAPTGVPVAVTLAPNDTQANVSAKVSLKSASGIDLFVPPLTVTLATKMSDIWPIVVPGDQLRLPPVIHKKGTSGELTLTGSPKGPTKVCFDPPKDVRVPAEEAGVVPQYTAGCVELGAGESKKVVIGVSPARAGQGPAQAVVPITLHSAALSGKPSETAPLPLRVEWRFENPPNTPVFLLAALIGLFLALAPLLAIVVANKVSARYEIGGLSTTSIPVILDSGGLRRAVPLADASLAGRIIDTTTMQTYRSGGKRRAKTVSCPSVDLKAHAPWNPFEGARFWVELPKGFIGFSTAGSSRGGVLPANPGLGFLGVIAVDPARVPAAEESGEIPATLVVFRRDRQARGEELDELVRACLGADAPARVRRSAAPTTASGAAGSPTGRTTADPTIAPVIGRRKPKK